MTPSPTSTTAVRQAVQYPEIQEANVVTRVDGHQLGARSDLAPEVREIQLGSRPGVGRSMRALWGVPVPGWKPPLFAADLWLPPVEHAYHIQGGPSMSVAACDPPDPHELVLLPPSWVARFGLKPCFGCRRIMRDRYPYGWDDLKADLRRAS